MLKYKFSQKKEKKTFTSFNSFTTESLVVHLKSGLFQDHEPLRRGSCLETSLTSDAQLRLFAARGLETSLASAAATLFAGHSLETILSSGAQCGYP